MAPVGEMSSQGHQIIKPNRDNYVGEKRNHLRDGYGVYKYENKFFKYEGQWNAGKKHGHGKLLMRDGSFYEGEFKDGEITGHGFKYWSSSRNTFSGQFFMGELEGDGIMRYSDGSVYEGQWQNNKREGTGKLTEVDSSFYEGEFHNNKKHGYGRYFSISGTEYEGNYINDKRHGHGIFKMVDGSVFEGQWCNDTFNGEGTLMHSSGFVYEGLWINGKPAVMATKIELCDTDASIGITISQGESFDIKIQTVNDEGEFIKDNGREFKVTAGYKYIPPTKPTKESTSSNLFEAIEDVEENLIKTPLGYTVLPYPITDQPGHPGLQSEDTNLSLATREGTIVEDEEKQPETGEAEHDGAEDRTSSPKPGAESEEVYNQAPASKKTLEGYITFSGLSLLPPPPLYRPFQLATEKSSTELKSKSSSKRVSSLPKTDSRTSSKTTKSSSKIDIETICRPGTYVLMIEDITDPPFMGETLAPIFTLINVKKLKRSVSVVPKEKGPKWDTSKLVASTVALHREDTFRRESTMLSENELPK